MCRLYFNVQMNRLLLTFLVALLLYALPLVGASQNTIPKQEFRAVWIATVVNIDWPSTKGLTSAEQKQEFIAILDFYQRLNFNAVIVQIRAAGDAFLSLVFRTLVKVFNGGGR